LQNQTGYGPLFNFFSYCFHLIKNHSLFRYYRNFPNPSTPPFIAPQFPQAKSPEKKGRKKIRPPLCVTP
jgi:hypothetical protein